MLKQRRSVQVLDVKKSAAPLDVKGNRFCVESYGVKLAVESNSRKVLEEAYRRLFEILPNEINPIVCGEIEHTFSINLKKNVFEFRKNDEKIVAGTFESAIFDSFESNVRITVAEFAVLKVFMHAGVVGWKGKAIILPARSYQGKTTLVAELVRRGALYYSDEYAVLDEDGYVHPFTKSLSMRGIIDDYRQVDFPVEELGGKKGIEPIPVGMVLLTGFKAKAKWKPRILSPGKGMMEMLSHTIPIRYNPKFSLKVLNKIANRAIIAKSYRGEAKDFANLLLEYYETEVI